MYKILNNKFILGAAGCVLAFLAMLQEHLLGTTDCAWVLALVVAACSGMFIEAFEWQVYCEGYKWKNVVAWVTGSVAAIILVLALW